MGDPHVSRGVSGASITMTGKKVGKLLNKDQSLAKGVRQLKRRIFNI
jgi:hypothetical protein